MMWRRNLCVVVVLIAGVFGGELYTVDGRPHRILLDTDVDTDDLLALSYLLKLNRSEFELEAVTISANAWTDAGHSVHHIYDILYMMNRDDIAVGVGGEGGILEDGTILPDVGGYLPIIEQGVSTLGGCRFRQAIPIGQGGRLDKDTNFGVRKSFLPQGNRKYSPLQQPTAQQVMIDKVSAGPITVFLIGSHTNFAIFLTNHPHLKKNVEHIYIMGGGVESSNPTGCCPGNGTSACPVSQCGDTGNLFTEYNSNPYAEFNIFGDPFAAYQVLHSGIPVTLVPLDATNTITLSEKFFKAFEQRQDTYEAQYCFQSLKMARDTWFDSNFYSSYFMWDSFTIGLAVSSIIRNSHNQDGQNEFADMKYMNITVVTSNEPFGISDGSNPFFDGRNVPKFHLKKGGVHSGHVQRGLWDPFCFVKGGKGKCKDGYTAKVIGPDAVRVLVAKNAKPSQDIGGELDRAFYKNFLDVINLAQHTGRFSFTTEFPYYREVFYKPDFRTKKLGKPVIFDMDMSAGDFLALFYLLKVPVQVIDLKAIIVSPTSWANAATIHIVYDLLHMMGRDDIPVGLGDVFAMNQTDPLFPAVGDCKYAKAIPHGSGGFLDSDTLFGFARDLPRSPRRYTAENSVEFGAPRNTSHPELRQPLAFEIWGSVLKTLDPGSKITVLTNGPLTNLAKIILSNTSTVSKIQRKLSSFPRILETLQQTRESPESQFTKQLLSRLHWLQQAHQSYQHMDIFLGEIFGAVLLSSDHSILKPTFKEKHIRVVAEGDESIDGQIVIDKRQGKSIKVLRNVIPVAYYDLFANRLSDKEQSAVLGSYDEQTKIWSSPPSNQEISDN
ncbi:hypothetical protein SLEP1_g245 [Rubroshorea leprosula]|uniref:Inosine/uridine-preferring nucleoside hydrolase domain-containing protein n=1 Tax=Rubroshorea leprosula TaxID=152421 RepID=A0AAV5HJ77_9ROSI|nr:hypothetical protein SLEP1_g245 [Rubroshorea leprosula]